MSNAPTTNAPIAPATLARFVQYAEDAGNWGGSPLVGGNVGGDAADKGFVLNMKKAGLVTTCADDGCVWIDFTDAGALLAEQHGVENVREA
uniref:Uncharacterized protein n=1 Tax=uncultured marine virus TaxID=186617 RepID=A0A0F7L6B0_9VIRU|nr:hypothetical protein [uncultured marine virus]